MTTYTALRYQDNLYLVREPVLERPEKPDKENYQGTRKFHGDAYSSDMYHYESNLEIYTNWLTKKQGWILVPAEHEDTFRGRSGLVEGKDFRIDDGKIPISIPYAPYTELVERTLHPENYPCAIPKEPGAGEEELVAAIKRRIKELNELDNDYCRVRWDENADNLRKALAREESNKVAFARQELEALITRKNP